MKKTILLVAFLLGTASFIQAQSVNFGVKAGLNFASLNGDDVDALDGRTGYHFGLVAEIGISDNFSIQPEAIYSAQGAKLGDVDFNVDYITVPVLAEFSLVENLSLQVGPQFGFVIADKNIEDPESFDLSGAAGLELSLGKFFAQARYNMGFSDVVAEGEAKNSVFQLSLGLNF